MRVVILVSKNIEIPESAKEESILPDTIEKVHENAFLNTNIKVLFITKDKSKFIEAGIRINKIVDLTKQKESFCALRNYTMAEIHQLESVFGCRILPENFYNFENKMSFKASYFNENLRYKDLFDHWKLKDVTNLKASMIDAVKKEDLEEIESDISSIHINNDSNCSLC